MHSRSKRPRSSLTRSEGGWLRKGAGRDPGDHYSRARGLLIFASLSGLQTPEHRRTALAAHLVLPVRRPAPSGRIGLEIGAAHAIQPGKVDRSPTDTALSARTAALHPRSRMKTGARLTAPSVIGSTFSGQILGDTTVGGQAAILPEISGRGWITGTHQHMLDPSDPWPERYRLPDTWGAR